MPPRRLSSTGCIAPVVPDGFVARPRLDAVVEAGVARGVVLVSAPPGYGKTLLLAGWAARRTAATAWLTVEPDDADPHLFWSRVLRALQVTPGLPSSSALARLKPPSAYDGRFPAALVEACAQLPGPRALVLDDLHLLMGTPSLGSLDAAVRAGLGELRLVLSTRADPSLGLQRLRLGDGLAEVRAQDLGFDASEAAEMLTRHDIHLEPAQLHELLAKTEGWAAGLRLAALSLRHRRDDLVEAVAELAGDQRTVGDYLVEEVLARQPAEVTSFLLDTCVVDRVCGDLANALTGRADGQRMLTLLEAENLFVVGLDEHRTWYRYHHMFGQMLRQRLLVERPERVGQLHRAAATWFAEQGERVEAARHLAAAGDWQELARFLMCSAGVGLLGPERPVILGLIRQIPAHVVETVPEAAGAAAAACYAESDATGLRAHAARAREGLDRLPGRDAVLLDGALHALEAAAAWLDEDAEGQVRAAASARDVLATITDAEMPSLPAYRVAVSAILALGYLWTGRLDAAEAELAAVTGPMSPEATGSSGPADTPVLALHVHGSLALLDAARGRLSAALTQAATALDAAARTGWLEPAAGLAFLAQAAAELGLGRNQSCAVTVARGEAAVGTHPSRLTRVGLALVAARLEVSRGNAEAAGRALAALRDSQGGWVMPAFLDRWCTVVEAEVDLALARPVRAVRRLTPLVVGGPDGARPLGDAVVLLARCLLAAGRPGDARTLLEPLRGRPPVDRVPAVEMWLTAALVDDALRDEARALEALERCLEAAASEGITRPFLLAGPRLPMLLRRYRQTHDRHVAFVAGLLGRAEGASIAGEPAEPLTGRERSVLVLLPAMMSNAEIADELFVSVNTVKVHLKSLYRKLGVANRRDAVRRARELGLLGGVDQPELRV